MTRESQQNAARLAAWIAKGGREKWLDERCTDQVSVPWLVLRRWAEQAGRIVHEQKQKNN